MPEQNPDDLITTVELAEICGVSIPTVRVWRRMQYTPLPAKGGGAHPLFWRRSTVETWWAANKPVLPPTEEDL